MIDWFARNSVAANLLMVSIIAGGLFSLYSELKVEIFPEVEPDFINVIIPLRGATPEDIELGVAIRIEEALQDLEGIEKMTSKSIEGSTSVSIEVDSDYEPRELLDDVKNRVDAINTFPVDTEKPVISLAQRLHEVITVVVAGVHNEIEIRAYAEQIREDLLRTEGITQVQLGAVRKFEISIEASQDKLRDYGLTLADIARAVQKSSLDISAGNIRTEGGDVLIRSKGQAYRQSEFEEIVVKTNVDGTIIRIADLAIVNDGFEEVSLRSRFNGEFAALINVFRIGDQSAIQIAKKTRQYIEEKQSELPKGIALSHWDDDSTYLKARLTTLIRNALQGGLLIIILLALFLKPAVAFWVVIGIPISFLGALSLMAVFDISINIMSVFGFIIVMGIIVDDAIVTGENVYTRMREGLNGLDAAITGTRQVAIPVTFGIMTTIAAFIPLGFIDGHMGDFMAPIPMVVIPCLIFSLIESKFVLPAHLKNIHVNNGSRKQFFLSRLQQAFADGFERLIINYYKPIIAFSIRNRYSVLAVFIGIFLLILAFIFSGRINFVFLPKIESDHASVNLTMPVGTPFQVTDRHIQRIVNAAILLKEKHKDGDSDRSIITDILATTGSAGRRGRVDNIGRVRIETIPSDQRLSDIKMRDLVNEWREMIGSIPGAENLTFKAEIIRTGDPISIEFSGHSLETLNEIGEIVKQRLTTYPTVFDISDSLSDGKEELQIELTLQGHVLGLTRSDIVNQVGQAFRGFQAQRIQRGRDDIRVIVRLPEDERSTLATLDEYLITSPDGRRVPLSHVARVTPGKSPSTITRIDRYRILTVTADIDKEKTNMAVLQKDLNEYLIDLLVDYPQISYVLEGEAKVQRQAFGSMKSGVFLLLFAIYSLLAIPLKSYIQPIVIMSVIPFGVIGAVFGHLLMGRDLSFLSILGLMALTGVVVNDSLVLVDYINQQRLKGISVFESAVAAGTARFRPVMLTSLTTFIGLLPLLSEKSVQAQFLIPMGISLGFGIIFATFITLFMVPANILIAEDLKRIFRFLLYGTGQNRQST